MKSGNFFDPDITTEERRIWVLEGELVATCADGSQMTYKTGPIGAPSPPGMTIGPATPQGYWDQWFKKAWGKVPKGLRIHPAPTLDTSEPSPDILEKVRVLNTMYPRLQHGFDSFPGFAHPPYIVQAGQRTKLDLHAGAASVGGIGGGGSKAVTITGYRMVPDRSHGKLEQDAQGDYYFTADADYQGPAYFYVKLLDERKGARPTINEAAGVPLQIVSAAKALELQQRKQARQQRHQAIMQLRKGSHTKVDQYFLSHYREDYKGMNTLKFRDRYERNTIDVIESAVENVEAKRNHPLNRKFKELTYESENLKESFEESAVNRISLIENATEAVVSAQALLNTVQKLNPQSAAKIQAALEHLNHVVVYVKQAKAISDQSQPAKDQLIIVADKALAVLDNSSLSVKQKGALLKKLLKIAKVASSHIDTQAEITALKKASEAGKHVAPLFKEAETILQADMHARIKAATAQEKADMLAGK